MEDLKKQALEEQLLELPLVQYAWMDIGDIEFSENVRHICRTECPRYGTSWSCPPAVGTVEECRERCEAYSGAFVFTTIAEVHDTENLEETLATRAGHEAVTRQIRQIFERSDCNVECSASEAPAMRRRILEEADGMVSACNQRTAVHSTLALSAESCALCGKCAYPETPCRHPEQMLPCIESYGIVVPKLAERAGIEFMNGAGIVTWFGIVLYESHSIGTG